MKKMIKKFISKQCIIGMTLNFDILVSLICNNINVW